MNVFRPKTFWLVWVGVCQLLSASLAGEPATNIPPSTRSNSTSALLLLPSPAPVKAPVEFFRELLAMSPGERNQFLSDRPPESRKLILDKVREYAALKPDERELRLRATELRWYLLRLMRVPATNRVAQMEFIPEETRKLLEGRLQQWDKLPPELQKQFLEVQATYHYLSEVEGATPQQKQKALETISTAKRDQLEAGIRRWQEMTDEQRQSVVSRFKQFFDLTAQEKEKTLKTLSEPERQQIEKTLRNFENLTAAQRFQCIRSFEKFAGLSREERQQFLKNAEQWKLMSPTERQAWRDLVANIPMLPLNTPASPPLPRPLTPRPAKPGLTPSIATNRN